jgi:cytochrome c553
MSMVLGPAWGALGAEAEISPATQDCLVCHEQATPALVADWKASRHFKTSPEQALLKGAEERRMSASTVPESLAKYVVGCAECHLLNPGDHKDTFEHEGQQVHVVVTPKDCATCHPVEDQQYQQNKMSRAFGNLDANALYQDLILRINGVITWQEGRLAQAKPDAATNAQSCYYCHGTRVEVTGTVTRETDFGEFEFPVLAGWPNQGVGRVNPDNSLGSCAACHTRHQFAVKMARQPYTCSQCHKGPDVPAYKVYEVSKHGNLFASFKADWNLDAVPWTAGRDFSAPTCAVCHVSQVMNTEGVEVAKRTHQMNDRLPWRLLGLIYAHPQPKSPDTSIIVNKAGLPLPTELTGEPVSEFLIDQATLESRTAAMQGVCRACHTQGWVEGHWNLLDQTIKTTNELTLTSTRIMTEAWDKGGATGAGAGGSIFDEPLERLWVEQWLFYANSTRLSAAMSGTDYGVFDNGRWYMSKTLEEMAERLEQKLKAKE